MDPGFTDDEKRYVLAEMIKTSRLDVNVLADFVRANVLDASWMHMQLPQGRNMNQCLRAAECMAIPLSSHKRRLSDDLFEPVAKRRPVPSTKPGLVPILPRPASGVRQMAPEQSSPTQPPVPAAPKKRGRPSRSDKLKDLRPNLPPQIIPGPLPQTPTQAQMQTQTPGSTPSVSTRPILPAPSPARILNEGTSPTRYSTSPGDPGGRGTNDGEHLQGDATRPRVMAEGALEQMRRTSSASASASASSPVPAKPELRANSPLEPSFMRSSLHPTLPPLPATGALLQNDPWQRGVQAPSTNST